MNEPTPAFSNLTEIIESYLGAFAARDFALARTFLVDKGFNYTSPLATYDNPDRFIQYLSTFEPILERLHIRKCMTSGNEVIAIVDSTITLNGYEEHTAAILFNIQDGRIKSIESVFDASDYYKLFTDNVG